MINMQKFFEITTKRIIFIGKDADSSFWDRKWSSNKYELIKSKVLNTTTNKFLLHYTRLFLKPCNGIILEGGCGKGSNVMTLIKNKYNCIGIDYAENTVKTLNKILPNLDIRLGDVRNLDFESNYFIGYWSLGVIEHYWNGYEKIANEMYRCLRENGYLFLTFPYMSPLRDIKVKLRLYKNIIASKKPDNFYQFALNYKDVIKDFKNIGFYFIKKIPFDGIRGIRNEIPFIKTFLDKIMNYQGKNILINILNILLSQFLAPIAGHSILLIFKKKIK
ncbi:MAG: methyltransferase domain-containing protein [Candidatus Lokiarchaeota archaeon]|nr:methyltransferase domain-containing protein [Candidatus Lokiarchaeota archaeon]